MRLGLHLGLTSFRGGIDPNLPFAVGGTETEITIGGVLWRVHTFTTDDTLTVNYEGGVEYLIVGSGAVGGKNSTRGAGGGGGGGILQGAIAVTAGAKPVVVGASVAGKTTAGTGTNGNPSSILGLTALGGGGGSFSGPGNVGGSGGGGTGVANPATAGGAGSQGNNGGTGYYEATTGNRAGGGGGGYGGAGGNAALGVGGAGGDGVQINFDGTLRWFSPGGGGSGTTGGNGGAPGDSAIGSGGDGGNDAGAAPAGVYGAATGGVHLGNGTASNPGVVMIRYPLENWLTFNGARMTFDGAPLTFTP